MLACIPGVTEERDDGCDHGVLFGPQWGERRSTLRRAVFLDRDGTINVGPEAGQYVRDPSQLRLQPGAAGAIRAINRSGALAVVVTNQRWLSSPGVSPAAFHPLEGRLRELLKEAAGAHLDACYVCPHQQGECACRKPAPGMLLRAAGELGVDLTRSTVIGDSPSDVAAGRAVGARCALLAGEGVVVAEAAAADRVFSTLPEAVEWAL